MQPHTMITQPIAISLANTKTPSVPSTMVGAPVISLAQIFPIHRLFVIIKTPLLIALGLYLGAGDFHQQSVLLTILLGSLLWTLLYALNEFTDLVHEQHLHGSKALFAVLLIAPLLICAGAIFLSPLLALLLTTMACGQIAYCVAPFRVKRFWCANLLLSGTMNPLLRLLCGAIWGIHPISLLTYVIFVVLHIGSAIRTRLLQVERDHRLCYTTAPSATRLVGMVCMAMGFLGMYMLCWQSVLPRSFYVFTSCGVIFTIYAWSSHATTIVQLRRGWLWFTILSLFALAALLKLH